MCDLVLRLVAPAGYCEDEGGYQASRTRTDDHELSQRGSSVAWRWSERLSARGGRSRQRSWPRRRALSSRRRHYGLLCSLHWSRHDFFETHSPSRKTAREMQNWHSTLPSKTTWPMKSSTSGTARKRWITCIGGARLPAGPRVSPRSAFSRRRHDLLAGRGQPAVRQVGSFWAIINEPPPGSLHRSE